MKIRTDFVTNSSSSSYVFWGFYSSELMEYVRELIKHGYIYDTSDIDRSTLKGYLANSEQAKDKAVLSDLRFFPYHGRDEKIGFQIEEENSEESAHKDALFALLDYINIESISKSEADEICIRISELVDEAEKHHQILCASRMGSTDDVNKHFSERNLDEVFFKIKDNVLISPWNKNSEKIICGSSEHIQKIGDRAFENMSRLKAFIADMHLLDIGDNAFSSCCNLNVFRITSDAAGLTDISDKYPDSSYIESKRIGKNAFCGCSSLKPVVYFYGAEVIGSGAFKECESLETVTFDSEIRKIESLAFSDCKNLKDVYFCDDKCPDGIAISPTAFENCDNLLFHVYEGSSAYDYAIANNISYKPKEKKIDNTYFIFNPEENIKPGAFRKSRIESLSVNCNSIGDSAFENITKLKNCSIFCRWNIGNDAFKGCSSLNNVKIYLNGNIGDNVFTNCTGLEQIEFYNMCRSIGNSAFKECINLNVVKLPELLSSIGKYSFENCTGLETINIDCKWLRELPEGIFSGCSNLKTVILPDGLKRIGSKAFKDCTSLEKIIFTGNLTYISDDAFENCCSLTDKPKVCDSDNNASVKINDMFIYMKPIDIYPTDTDHSLDYGEFTDSSYIIVEYTGKETSVSIPKEIDGIPVVDILPGALDENVQSVYIPASFGCISRSCFANAKSLKYVYLPEGLTSIKMSAFAKCTSLEGVYIPDSVTNISKLAFDGCSNLKNVFMPNGKGTNKEAFVRVNKNQLTIHGPKKSFAENFAKKINIPFLVDTRDREIIEERLLAEANDEIFNDNFWDYNEK